ncbi:YjbE family putative metal transport protein [Candidatus Spongiihabitans sp.]|uniref:YjbE family putative metal transport protein n=1 Tax=Candidatus Spongiihabitans sp. TaxID=3101308 RepID=UPI003C6FCEF8
MEFTDQAVKLIQIIFVDLVLAGDNAIVIGLVAAKFSKDYRRKVIFYGVGVAVILRILFALVTVQILAIKGLPLVGGLLLLWICWKLWQDLRHPHTLENAANPDGSSKAQNPPLLSAIFQIIMADVSMSLDNVLAVAGIADGHSGILVIGLTLSVVLMTIAASIIAETLQKHRWIGFVGVAVILYVGIKMIVDGYLQVFPSAL